VRELGLLVMAYGTARGPDDIERYYTDIRGGRPPSPEHLEDLRRRYEAIGNTFPLERITREQAEALQRELNAGEGPRFRAYLGWKHSPPHVQDVVRRMAEDGLAEAVGIVMAPHYSRMSIGGYAERVRRGLPEDGSLRVSVVESWYDHPAFVEVLAERLHAAMASLTQEERRDPLVVFTAHSLPERIVAEGDPYPDQLQETAALVSTHAGVETDNVTVGWQSAGRTEEPWLGPPLEEVVAKAAADGRTAVVVVPCGFVSDHLEILYDIDIEAQEAAHAAEIRLVRTESMNAAPRFISALAEVVRDHVRAVDHLRREVEQRA
jgi:protoporphyrin/coproporphyrin ferrochelatase